MVDTSVQPTHAQLKAIIQAQREITRFGLDLNAVMSLVLERTQAMTDANSAAIELVAGNDIIYRAVSGAANHMLGLRLHIDKSLSGTCVRERQLIRCDDSEADPRVDLEACRAVGLRSMIVAPLEHHDDTVGVIKVMSPEPNNFDEADEAVMTFMSGIVAEAMDNATRLQQDELFRQATTDFLTGLANRSFFIERLRSTMDQSDRENRCFAVLMLDMDGLKGINDTHGHNSGDAAIREMAKRLSEVTRRSDIVARIGGDEFAITLSVVEDRVAAEEFAKRIMVHCGTAFTFEDLTLMSGVSIGVAVFPDDGRRIDRLLAVADERMYICKHERRNARLANPE